MEEKYDARHVYLVAELKYYDENYKYNSVVQPLNKCTDEDLQKFNPPDEKAQAHERLRLSKFPSWKDSLYCFNPSENITIKPESWSSVIISLASCSNAQRDFDVKPEYECTSTEEERKEYLDPEALVDSGKQGLNIDFVYNYEIFDAEEYG